MVKKAVKRFVALILLISMLGTLNVQASNLRSNADRLSELGLFHGNNGSYDLNQPATRMQGLIMMIRLLGEEQKAMKCTAACPFTDVGEESKCYVAYACQKGYIHGTSANTFSPDCLLQIKTYVSFLLRCLGYNEQNGDYSASDSPAKAKEIGLMDLSSANYIAANDPILYRSDLVDLTISALTMKLKGKNMTLAEQLVKQKIFTKTQAKNQGVIGSGKIVYTYEVRDFSTVSRTTATYALPSGNVKADVITVNLKNPYVNIKTGLDNGRLGTTASFKNIVSGAGADVVINANFFESYQASKAPIGYMMVDGKILNSCAELTVFGFTEDGEIRVGRPSLSTLVESGKNSWIFYKHNYPTHTEVDYVLYNSAYGDSVTFTCAGKVAPVYDGYIQDVVSVNAGDVVKIPENGYLMFYGKAVTKYRYFMGPKKGAAVTVTPQLSKEDSEGFHMDGVTNAVAGGPRLVQNGSICTYLEKGFQEARFTTAVTSRTAIGKLGNGKLVIVSTGAASIQQMRELMLHLECVEAVNLDGGGSTALAYQNNIIRNAGRELTATLQVFVQE